MLSHLKPYLSNDLSLFNSNYFLVHLFNGPESLFWCSFSLTLFNLQGTPRLVTVFLFYHFSPPLSSPFFPTTAGTLPSPRPLSVASPPRSRDSSFNISPPHPPCQYFFSTFSSFFEKEAASETTSCRFFVLCSYFKCFCRKIRSLQVLICSA